MIDFNDWRAKVQIPPQFKDAYKRLMTAALGIMFSAKTHNLMVKTIQAPGGLAKNVGEGAAGLVLLVYKEAKNAPGELMIPAGLEIVLQTFEYIDKTKMVQYQDEDVGQAIQVMIETILKASGANMDAYEQATGGAGPAPAGAGQTEGNIPQTTGQLPAGGA